MPRAIPSARTRIPNHLPDRRNARIKSLRAVLFTLSASVDTRFKRVVPPPAMIDSGQFRERRRAARKVVYDCHFDATPGKRIVSGPGLRRIGPPNYPMLTKLSQGATLIRYPSLILPKRDYRVDAHGSERGQCDRHRCDCQQCQGDRTEYHQVRRFDAKEQIRNNPAECERAYQTAE